MPPTHPVPRFLRVVNAGALLLFLAGGWLHFHSWRGMERLRQNPPEAGDEPFVGMTRFNDLWELSRLGTWLILTACAIAVLAAAAAVVIRRRSSGEPAADRTGA